MKQRPFLGAGVLALGLGLLAPACGSSTADALSVNGQSLSRSDFEDELEAYSSNTLIDPQTFGLQSLQGDGESYSAEFARLLLQRRISFEVLEQEVERNNVATDDPTVVAVATELAPRLVGTPEAFDALPEKYRNEIVEWARAYFSYGLDATQSSLDEAALAAAHDAQLRQLCVSHLLVATEAEAADARAEIEGGAAFADVASRVSTDTGSAANGGKLYQDPSACPTASQLGTEFVKPFADAALALPVGEVSEPVESEFGWHVLVVDSEQPAPAFDPANSDEIENVVLNSAAAATEERIGELLGETEVSVDSRYGTWSQAQREILPPGQDETPTTVAPTTAAATESSVVTTADPEEAPDTTG